jgi:mRNA-degrading endonuclease RelE of RelBE toxin-antitoxin system
MAYRIRFADTVVEHLRWLEVAERRRVLDAIEVQLSNEPLSETRNRRPLRPNPIAPWELRVGKLRVFDEVAADDPRVVRILAVGKKERQTLRIGGKEIAL